MNIEQAKKGNWYCYKCNKKVASREVIEKCHNVCGTPVLWKAEPCPDCQQPPAMRYKKGDKVKIKTWEQMLFEYGGDEDNLKVGVYGFCRKMEDSLKGKSRIATIAEVGRNYYYLKLEGCDDIWKVHSDYYTSGWLTFGVTDEALEPCQQPPASSEFTKKIREWIDNSHFLETEHSLPDFVTLATQLLEACDRLESLVAENKQLRQGIIDDKDGSVILVPTDLYNQLESRLIKQSEAIEWLRSQAGYATPKKKVDKDLKRILGEDFEELAK